MDDLYRIRSTHDLILYLTLTLTFPTKLSSRHLSSTFMNCKQLNISKTFLVGIIVNFIQDEISSGKDPGSPNPVVDRQARGHSDTNISSLHSKIKMHLRLPADASTLL